MIVRDQKELKKLQIIGEIVANCLKKMIAMAEPGMDLSELDAWAASYLKEHGALSAPKVMYEFPGTTCISINREAAHGIPSKGKILKAGDLVNIDVSAVKDELYGDTGGSFLLASQDTELKALCKATRKALNRAIGQVKANSPLNIIGKSVEKEAQKAGFTVIRNLCSHGIGYKLHEQPDHIPGFFSKKEKRILQENMVITIEPFLSTGTENITDGKDGWALLNKPGCYSAQYEHSMVITKGKPIILTEPTD